MQRVIADHVYSWRCPVSSFTDVSFTVVVYGENAFWATGDFSLQYRKWPLGIIGNMKQD